MQFRNVVSKFRLKLDYISLVALSAKKVLPCCEKILNAYNFLTLMSEHKSTNNQSQPAQVPLVLVRTKEAYQLWHAHLVNLKRIDRYTIGVKIDDVFLSLLEHIFRACFAYDKFEKLSLISQAIGKCDLLKFLLQIGWENRITDHALYGKLILLLDETGRMLGGWKKSQGEKTPAGK